MYGGAFPEAIEAALELGDLGKVEALLAFLPKRTVPRFLEAHAMRFKARLAAARGEDAEVEPRFKNATGMFIELAVPFWAAVAQLEHAEWLAERGRADDARPLIEAALPVFERLRTVPILRRARNVVGETIEAS